MRKSLKRSLGALLVVGLLPSVWSTLAWAAGGAPARKGGAIPAEFQERIAQGDEGSVRALLDDLRAEGPAAKAKAPVIGALLSRGLPDELARAALVTVSEMEGDAGADVVLWYTRHRNPQVRLAAVKALGGVSGKTVTDGLRLALSDADPTVRSAAATVLGNRGDAAAVSDLLRALERGVVEAAGAVGKVCSGAPCGEVVTRVGKVPFATLMPALEAILLRPPRSVGEDVQLRLVQKLAELQTAEVTRFLASFQNRWPAHGSLAVRKALTNASNVQTVGSP